MSPGVRTAALAALGLLVVAAFWYGSTRTLREAEKLPPAPSVAGGKRPSPPSVSSAPRPEAGPAPAPASPSASALPVAARSTSRPDPRHDRAQVSTELEKVRFMIRDYRTLMGENPVGTNAEIMQALMGGNPRQARLGPPEGQTLSGTGELLDPWGHPYFFHQLSRENMEIHSAGPDGVLGTSDDLIER